MTLNDKVISALTKCDLFSSVSQDSLKKVLNSDTSYFAEYKSGQLIFSCETSDNAIGFIVTGSAKVVKKGGSLMITRLFQNDIFGFQTLFTGRAYEMNEIYAACDTLVFYITKSAVVALTQLEKNFQLDFIRMLSKEVYFLNKKLCSLTGASAESRLADFLLAGFGDYKTFTLDIPMSQLAFSLNMGRASLYRALDSLIEGGIVEKEGKLLRLINREKLLSLIK